MAMLPVASKPPSTESYQNPNAENGSATSYQSTASVRSRREGGANNEQTPNLTRTRPNSEDSFKTTLKKKQQQSSQQSDGRMLQAVAQTTVPNPAPVASALAATLSDVQPKADSTSGSAPAASEAIQIASTATEPLTDATKPGSTSSTSDAGDGQDNAEITGSMVQHVAQNAQSAKQVAPLTVPAPTNSAATTAPAPRASTPPTKATSIAAPAVSAASEKAKSSDDQAGSGSKSSSGSSSQQSPQGGFASVVQVSATQTPTPIQDVKVAQASFAERVAVINQIASSASKLNVSAATAPSAQHSVTINVSPEHWGDLKIALTMPTADAASNGAGVSATITAQTVAVRDALDAQVKDLRQALQTAGVKVDKLEVIVAANSATAAARATSESGFQQNSNFSQQHGQSGAKFDSGGQGSKQGQQQGQQFASLFGDSSSGGSNRNAAAWLPSILQPQAETAATSEALSPISIVDATSANFYNSRGMNVLA